MIPAAAVAAAVEAGQDDLEPNVLMHSTTRTMLEAALPLIFPRDEGDTTVIGPGCFAAKDGSVLNWRGVNYVPQSNAVTVISQPFGQPFATTGRLQPAAALPPYSPPIPTIGRTVWYRSRTGAYTVPAIITATMETLNMAAVEAKLIPDLSSPLHVHLTVLSPGLPVVGQNASLDALGDPPQVRELPPGARSFNLAGTYQEWDVRFFDSHGLRVSAEADPPDDGAVLQLPGSWTWPVIR